MTNVLLTDCIGYTTLSFNESSNGSSVMKFRGKFQEANQVNKNKRMYPMDVLASNVDKLIETVNQRGMLGELDHPQDSIVHLANVSHLVTKLWWEGNTLMGEGEILNTPSGKVMKSLMDGGVRVGISSRGIGNGQVNNEGVLVIGESYKLITFDMVADPSTLEAYQQKIISKQRESFSHMPNIVQAPAPTKKTLYPTCAISFMELTMERKLQETKAKIKASR